MNIGSLNFNSVIVVQTNFIIFQSSKYKKKEQINVVQLLPTKVIFISEEQNCPWLMMFYDVQGVSCHSQTVFPDFLKEVEVLIQGEVHRGNSNTDFPMPKPALSFICSMNSDVKRQNSCVLSYKLHPHRLRCSSQFHVLLFSRSSKSIKQLS